MGVEVSFDKNPPNLKATAMVLDLRNSTVLHRLLSKKKQRELIASMMIGIHEEILPHQDGSRSNRSPFHQS